MSIITLNTRSLPDSAVTTAKIAADAVTDAKVADDIIGTEHLTAGEVDATALGANAVTAAKLNNDIISGLTELASAPASTDEFLVSDAGTIKRIDFSLIGGANTPSFQARSDTGQSISNTTHTDVVFGEEIFDTDSAFASNVFTVPSGKAGKYLLYAQAGRQNWDSDRFLCYLARTRSGTTADLSASESHDGQGYHTTNTLCIADLQVGDVIKVVVYHDSGSTRTISTGDRTTFQGFKLI